MAAKFTYDALLNDNVQFLQGTQADLNKFLPTSSDANKGKAVEGAFYLTTDTHRLYVGRKVTAVPNPNPHSVAVDDVYPEEVSTGIATVASTGELSSVQTGGAAHDGDFYYIQDTNVLAVYKENSDGTGQWVQINSPTGISSFSMAVASNTPTATTFGSSSDYVRIQSSLQPAGVADPTTAQVWLKAGDNVTLKPSANNQVIEISSENSQSNLGIEAETTATTNKSAVVLSDGVNLDTKVNFIGENDTTTEASYSYTLTSDAALVTGKTYYTRSGTSPNYTYTAVSSPEAGSLSSYYERAENITIAGPYINGAKATARGTVGATSGNSGFELAVEVQNGNTASTRDAKLAGTGSVVDPKIRIGSGTTTDVAFYGGTAVLDVYTKSQTDTQISNSITNALKDVDALHYKGTVASATAVANLDNGTVEAGDVYKASADFTLNNTTVKAGDLIIAQGTETNGVIPQGNVTWEIVPSGDEPLLAGYVNANANGPQFGLEDQNIAEDYASASNKLAKRPLGVSFDNANSTLVHASTTSTSADNIVITLAHQTPSSGSITTVTSDTVTAASGTDSLAVKDQVATFTAIKSITRDAYGHVTGVAGQSITLKHNYIDQITASHSATNNVGTILIGASDALGITDTALNSASTKGNIKIGSSTLAIAAAADNTQLNVDLKWGSF